MNSHHYAGLPRGKLRRLIRLALVSVIAVVALWLTVSTSSAQEPPTEPDYCDSSITIVQSQKYPYPMGLVRHDADCAITKKVVSLTEAEYEAYLRDDTFPSDIWERSDISDDMFAAAEKEAEENEGFGELLAFNSSAAKNRACHNVLFACVGMVEVLGGFTWEYSGGIVVDYFSPWQDHWTGNCWQFQLSIASWNTGGLPTTIGRLNQAWFQVSGCPGSYGGSLTVTPFGTGNGIRGQTCSQNFSGPWPTVFSCTPL